MCDLNKTKAQLITELEDLRKKITENSKEKRLKQLWAVYSHSPIPSLVLSREGEIIEYNNAMKKLTGYSHKAVPDIEAWMPKIYPDEKYRKHVIETSNKSRKRQIEVVQEEFTITRKNGEKSTIEFYVSDIIQDGKPIDLQIVQCVDITQRKEAEEALRESEVFIRTVMDHIPIGVAVNSVDPTVDFTYMNNNFPKFYRTTGEALADPDAFWSAVYEDPEFREEIKERILDDCATGDPERMYWADVPITRRGEETTFISARNIPVPGKKLMISTVWDITERKRSEDSLRENEEKYRVLAESSPIGIFVSDEKRFIYVNQRLGEITGFSEDEILNMTDPVGSFFAPEERERVLAYAQSRIRGGAAPDSYEVRGIRKNGEEISLKLTVSSISLSGRRVLQGVVEDITEHKQLEEERLKASKLESIGLLAGGIAHDFNNILSAILGNISLAKITIDNNDGLVELLEETEKASIRATKLTQQLLTFSKGGAPVKETTEIVELIGDTTVFSLRGSNVKYRTSIPSDLWTADVDKGQISQVIGNLVINAQQAMPKGGIISINAKNVKLASKRNLPLSDGNYILISVADEGNGIPEEHLPKIFDPYFTSKQRGSGLGLATAYSIIHRHKGHIAVESEVGVGTTFYVYLPASLKQVKKKIPNDGETEDLNGNILLMDDEKSILKVAGMMLRSLGNVIEVTRDGEEAIKIYKRAMNSDKAFDVVIMDLTIPGGIGGKEAIQKLIEIDPDVKAIVSSGYSNDPVISNYKRYGFSGYIPKPYSLGELRHVLTEVMKLRK